MTKEQEVMAYLHQEVFDPILESATASKRLKDGVRMTIARMNRLSAASMVKYYWSSIVGTDRSIDFAKSMKSEGFNRFEEILEDFREQFDEDWLGS